MQINSVSFGAKLLLDKPSKSFIAEHNKKEVNEFLSRIECLGNKKDVVEINNLAKHHSSNLLIDKSGYQYNDCIYMKPVITHYTADVKINGVLNKISIDASSENPTDLPLKQIAGIVYNELNDIRCGSNELCYDKKELRSYVKPNRA